MKFLIFSMIISIILVTGESLRCYQCHNCPEIKKTDSNLKNCTGDICVKVVLKASNDTIINVERMCVNNTLEMKSSYDVFDVKTFGEMNTYLCGKESCNGAGSVTAVLSIIFTSVVALIIASEDY